MPMRGLRGATTVETNDSSAIIAATREMLEALVANNNFDPADVASALFTTTTDLNAAFPAVAARQMGWIDVPLMCGHEMDVPGALAHCIRVLLHVNTHKAQREMRSIYLHSAVSLRRDLAESYGSSGPTHIEETIS